MPVSLIGGQQHDVEKGLQLLRASDRRHACHCAIVHVLGGTTERSYTLCLKIDGGRPSPNDTNDGCFNRPHDNLDDGDGIDTEQLLHQIEEYLFWGCTSCRFVNSSIAARIELHA